MGVDLFQCCRLKVGLVERRLVELCSQCQNLLHLCLLQGGLAEVNRLQAGAQQVRSHQLGTDKPAAVEHGASEIGAGEIDSVEIKLVESCRSPDGVSVGDQGQERVPSTFGSSSFVTD